MPNERPTLSIVSDIAAYPAVVVEYNEWVRLMDILIYTDPEGDPLVSLELFDGFDIFEEGDWWLQGSGYLTPGIEHVVTDVENIWFRGEAMGDASNILVRANDGGGFGDWLTISKITNGTPTLTIPDQVLLPGGWRQLSAQIDYDDPDGDGLTAITLWDDVGGNSWWIDGIGYVDASAGYEVQIGAAATEMSQIWYQADAAPGSQTLFVRAKDQYEWGVWESFTVTGEAPPTPPRVTIADQSAPPGEWLRLADILDYSDVNGDPATMFALYDGDGAVDNWWIANVGHVDATSDATNGYVTTAPATDIWLKGDPAASSQTMFLRAHDGTGWSDWDGFVFATNTPPTVAVVDQAIGVEKWRDLSTVLAYADAEGDAFQAIEVWDDTDEMSWWVAGVGHVDATTGYQPATTTGIWFQGAAGADTQTLWVRAYDGTDWSAWDSFELETAL